MLKKNNLKTHFQVLKFSFFAGKSSEVLRTFMLVVAQNVCLLVLSSFVESFGCEIVCCNIISYHLKGFSFCFLPSHQFFARVYRLGCLKYNGAQLQIGLSVLQQYYYWLDPSYHVLGIRQMKAHEMLGLIYMLSCRQVESCLSISVSLFYMTVHGNKILTLKKQGQLDHYRLHN